MAGLWSRHTLALRLGSEVQHRDRESPNRGAPKEVGMDAKKKQVESEELRKEQTEPPEFEVPEEMETWALDDLSDLVPNTFV